MMLGLSLAWVALLGLTPGLHCWMPHWDGFHCWVSHWGCIAGFHTGAVLLVATLGWVVLLGPTLGLHCWVPHWRCTAGCHTNAALLGPNQLC